MTETLTLTDFLLARFTETETEIRLSRTVVVRGDGLRTNDPATTRRLVDIEAKRRIVVRLAQAERLCQANAEKHAEVSRGGLDTQEQITALRTHGWELAGRRDALRYVVDVMAAVYADHPDYREEWKP